MSALHQYQYPELADTKCIIEWSQHKYFDHIQLDCLTALMLGIIDGHCHLDPQQQQAIVTIYSVTGARPGNLFDPQIYRFIECTLQHRDALSLKQVHQLRQYADATLPQAAIKACEQMLWDVLYL